MNQEPVKIIERNGGTTRFPGRGDVRSGAYTPACPGRGEFMRMSMTVSIPVAAGNTAVRNGSLGTTIQHLLADLKPEAAYFYEDHGERTGFIVFDMKDSAQWVAVAEPWFLAFNARLSVRPAMNSQDLEAAMPGMKQAVESTATDRVARTGLLRRSPLRPALIKNLLLR